MPRCLAIRQELCLVGLPSKQGEPRSSLRRLGLHCLPRTPGQHLVDGPGRQHALHVGLSLDRREVLAFAFLLALEVAVVDELPIIIRTLQLDDLGALGKLLHGLLEVGLDLN